MAKVYVAPKVDVRIMSLEKGDERTTYDLTVAEQATEVTQLFNSLLAVGSGIVGKTASGQKILLTEWPPVAPDTATADFEVGTFGCGGRTVERIDPVVEVLPLPRIVGG